MKKRCIFAPEIGSVAHPDGYREDRATKGILILNIILVP
jgi:hypothetical protein